ncbi:MAG: hypothetical protein FJ358_07965 [Thaumarchaeota archaeon]|nr:hypothetical protein [Nitrososphaerota archaeon]
MRVSKIETPEPFNLDYSLECGQVFHWKKIGEYWHGVLGNGAIKLRQIGEHLEFTGSSGVDWHDRIQNYFRFDDDLKSIARVISHDKFVSHALQKYRGLRILRQDPWECMLSYICATNTNIPQIERMLDNLCRTFGERMTFDAKEFYTFPSADTLAKASVASIRDCKAGYRAEFIKATANVIAKDVTIFDKIRTYTYGEAREELLRKFQQKKIFKGIGPKVADCVLLFSLDKLEALPIDVWILRTIVNQYARLFDKEFLSKLGHRGSLSFKDYDIISKTMRDYFGKYAGYAQEYIYHYARTLL